MIKRIIFDLDDTLIEWNDIWRLKVKDVFDSIGITYNEDNIRAIMEDWRNYIDDPDMVYTKESFVKMVNRTLNQELNEEFFWQNEKELSVCVPGHIDAEIYNTLEYLKGKYELVILTNWFANSQIGRLRECDMLKYFSYVYGWDNTKGKPHFEAYQKAIGNYLPSECLMIGDSLKKDVLVPIFYGMDAIFFNKKNKVIDESHNNIKTISSFSDIKNYL